MEIMTKEDIERASAFLESGEAVEYLRSLAIEKIDLVKNHKGKICSKQHFWRLVF